MIKTQNSQGSALLIVLIVVGVVAIIGALGWVLFANMSKGGSGNPLSVLTGPKITNPEAQKACNDLYHDDELCRFAGTYDPAASYKLVMDTKTAQGQTSSITIENDGKDNSAITGTSGEHEYATVYLDGISYIKGEDGTWIKYPKQDDVAKEPSATDNIKFDFQAEKNKPKEQQVTYKKVSTEACGDITCSKYQVNNPSEPNLTMFMYFGTSDYKLHKWSTKDKDGNETSMVITYMPVSVKAPSPVKEVSASDQSAIQDAMREAQAGAENQ